METLRYDRSAFKATRTDEGYLVDTPIVGRVGIQVYKNADGTIRRELRPPEEVFHADSLATFAGKPITDNHPSEDVTSKNAKALTVGVMQTAANQDGDNVRVPIVIHDAEVIDKIVNGGKRELSVGYKVDLDETPGIWTDGQPYDAIQRKIRVNHLAIVPRGRAGNARLNLDRLDAVVFNPDEDDMPAENLGRVRLDNGLEYQAAPEVVVALDKMRADAQTLNATNATLTKSIDALTAERDTLKSQVASAEKVRADALQAARVEVKARAELEKAASEFKIDTADKTDREIREAVIKTGRADADLAGKSDEYIAAAFDMTVVNRADAAVASQRAAGNNPRNDSQADKSAGTHAGFMADLGKAK